MSSEGANAFTAGWAAAGASERAHSQPFLCELCNMLGVARPGPTREKGYAFEYDVTEHHPDGFHHQGPHRSLQARLLRPGVQAVQAAKAAASQLELAAQEAGVIEKKKSSQPVRGTGAWDDAMIKARGQAGGRGRDSGDALRDGEGAARPTLHQGYGGASQGGRDVSALML